MIMIIVIILQIHECDRGFLGCKRYLNAFNDCLGRSQCWPHKKVRHISREDKYAAYRNLCIEREKKTVQNCVLLLCVL